jgi:hypothetical protein
MRIAIVVPTRNRADLAPTTIASALAGSDPRVSVLVSDNSTDSEQADSLQAWCEAAAEERLHYVRPARPLPMSEHWQWALGRALEAPDVSHVMYLTDRLVLREEALPVVAAIIEQFPRDVITYSDDVILDYEQPVKLFERPWTGKVFRVDAAELLRSAARGIVVASPTMLNTVVPRAVLADIQEAYGSVFASIAPDHCFANRCLDRVDSILHCDRPLIVQRGLWRSNGFSQIRGVKNEDHADFLRELGDSGINQHTPVPALLTVTNAIYNEYEFVRQDSASSKLKPLKRHYYLGANARDVARLEDPQLQARMYALLAEHGWSRWMRLRCLIGVSISAAGYHWRRPQALLERLRPGDAPSPEFRSSDDALAYLLDHSRTARPAPDHLWPVMTRPGVARELPSPLNGAASPQR